MKIDSNNNESDSNAQGASRAFNRGDDSGLPVSRRSILKTAPAVGFGGFALGEMSDPVMADSNSKNETGSGDASTPPVGWNSWNSFACDVSADLVKQTADAIVDSGMRDVGYEYVNIDDCWLLKERDSNGNLQPDPDKFPNGIAGVADYVHGKDLKLGIYESAGTETCAGYPGSLGHEQQDAQSFADWGVDYLKYDNCGDHLGMPARERYSRMHRALEATDRDIVFSICEWGTNHPWLWGDEVGGNLWRTTGDIKPVWDSPDDSWYNGVVDILDKNAPLAPYAGPGHWNDPDMLEVGVDFSDYPGLSTTESRSHFSMWAMMSAPLLAGNDVRKMSQTTEDILTNGEVVDLDQDPLGIQARRIHSGEQAVWVKPLSNGDRAVALLNRGDESASFSTSVKEICRQTADAPTSLDENAPAYVMRNLWTHDEVTTAGVIRSSVPVHGVSLFRVRSGQPHEAPPSVVLSVSFSDDSSDDEFALQPGETRDLTTTVTNDSPTPVENLTVGVDLPDGWRSEPSSVSENSLAAGEPTLARTASGNDIAFDWSITAPEDATAGSYDLTFTADTGSETLWDRESTLPVTVTDR